MRFPHLPRVLAAMLIGAAAASAGAQPLDKMVFARAAPWGIVDAPIAYAVDLGFFKQERIDPEFVVVGGSYAALQQILSGAAQTGFVANEAIPTSLQPGKTPMPLRVAYSYHRNSPIFEIVVPASSSVRKLADLKGKKIGVLTLATGNVPVTKAGLHIAGLQATDYTLLPVGIGAQATQALTSGQIDALNLWHAVHAQIEEGSP
jgi:NitT/TauT family transport system substrate-binding protein